MRGKRSQVLDADQARAMAERRPNTRLVELDTDHFVHDADPVGFSRAVSEFLGSLDLPD
jgi:pimeloyl-ACP methyl ester carboxylesterase